MKHPALSPDLNRAILLLAPRFEARDIAPETLRDVLQAPGIVFAGASDATVYGDPHVNHAFRAWHDSWHARGKGENYPFPFTLAGEREACEAQIRELQILFPNVPKIALDIIRAEIILQGELFERTGQFPVDQYAFIKSAIERSK